MGVEEGRHSWLVHPWGSSWHFLHECSRRDQWCGIFSRTLAVHGTLHSNAVPTLHEACPFLWLINQGLDTEQGSFLPNSYMQNITSIMRMLVVSIMKYHAVMHIVSPRNFSTLTCNPLGPCWCKKRQSHPSPWHRVQGQGPQPPMTILGWTQTQLTGGWIVETGALTLWRQSPLEFSSQWVPAPTEHIIFR